MYVYTCITQKRRFSRNCAPFCVHRPSAADRRMGELDPLYFPPTSAEGFATQPVTVVPLPPRGTSGGPDGG